MQTNEANQAEKRKVLCCPLPRPNVRRNFHRQCTSAEGEGEHSRGGATLSGTISVLSRVLISVDKALLSASSLGIGPVDDPDIQYLSKVRKERRERLAYSWCNPKAIGTELRTRSSCPLSKG